MNGSGDEISFCRHCGAEVTEAHVFCTKCGSKVERYQPGGDVQVNAAMSAAIMPGKTKSYSILSICGMFIIAVLLALPFISALRLAFKEYSHLRGILASPFVGMAQFKKFFANEYSGRIVRNTLFVNICGILPGVVYVLLGEMAIRGVRNKFAKAFVAFLFCLPAILPANLFYKILPVEFVVKPSPLLVIVVSVLQNLRLAALITVGSFIVGNPKEHSAPKCALLYVAIRLIWLFTVDTIINVTVYNSLVYNVLDTLSTNTFRSGYVMGEYSYAAAIEVLRNVYQLIPGVAGCFILKKFVSGKDADSYELSPVKGDNSIAVGIGSLAVGLVLPLASAFDIGDMVASAMFNGFVYSLSCALAVSGLGILLYLMGRKSGLAGLIALTLMLVLTGCITGAGFSLRIISKNIPSLAVTLYSLGIAPAIALIIMYALQRGKGLSCARVFPGLLGILFAYFWGDSFSAQIFCADRSKFPASLFVREVMLSMNGTALADSVAVNKSENNPVIVGLIVFYIIIPLVVSLVGFVAASVISQRKRG